MEFYYTFLARGEVFVKLYAVKNVKTFEYEVSSVYNSYTMEENKKFCPAAILSVCNSLDHTDLAIPVARYDDFDFTTLDDALMKEVLKAVIHSFENGNSHAIGDLRGLFRFLDDCKELYE